MKKTIRMAAILLAILIFTIANLSYTQISTTALNTEKVVVGIIFQSDPFMDDVRLGYLAAAKEAGITCQIANAEFDEAKEAEIINTCIAQNVDGIAISPLSETKTFALLKKANEAGIQIATCNSDINKNYIVGNFFCDNFKFCAQTGAAAAKYIKKHMKTGVKIGILQFKSVLPVQSTARVNGFLSGLKKAGVKYTIVASKDEWIKDKAAEAITEMLNDNPSINLVYAANPGATEGATVGIINAGLAGKVVVFGTDEFEQLDNLLNDNSNVLQAVTCQDPFTIGYKTMKALINAINGGNTSKTRGKTIIIPGLTFTRENALGNN